MLYATDHFSYSQDIEGARKTVSNANIMRNAFRRIGYATAHSIAEIKAMKRIAVSLRNKNYDGVGFIGGGILLI